MTKAKASPAKPQKLNTVANQNDLGKMIAEVVESTSKSVLAMIINPAPVENDPEKRKTLDHERETTPWFACLPDLGVSMMVRDEKGNPVTGFWRDQDAKVWCGKMHDLLAHNPALLTKVRENPEWPGTIDKGHRQVNLYVQVTA